MKQYQSVFKRYESKYILSTFQYRNFSEELQIHMSEDQYGKTTICNIYYDTPNHRIIRSSLEKPVYKEKLRLRSYGIPQEESRVFIELKKKFDGIVYKRRIEKSLSDAVLYLNGGGEPGAEKTQIEKEIDRVLNFYSGIRPAMFLSYDRIAFFSPTDPELRITFDSKILWREKLLDLTAGVWGQSLLLPGEHLMEIKVPRAFPLWLSAMLDRHHIVPASFSKYGNAYTASLGKSSEKKKGVIYCA